MKLGTTKAGILACITPVDREKSQQVAHQPPVDTTICEIMKNPPVWNNKLVRIRGHFSGNFEYSMLSGDGCKDATWFGYADGDGPPRLVAYVGGGTMPGSEDTDGKLILPIPINLIRDTRFDRFEKQAQAMAKADGDAYKKDPSHFECHCVAATFTGRIDAVSPDVHEFRRTHPPERRSDFLGFGQMGLFEAEFILQSVNDDAVLEVCSE